MSAALYAKTVDLLKRYSFHARKNLSQNFLVDEAILNKIVFSIDPTKEDCVLEVGAGLGTLTEILAEKAGTVIALEVDKELCQILKERLRHFSNLAILQENILKFDIRPFAQSKKCKGVGNLPYHLSGSILRWFLNNRDSFSELTFMLQKEVAERIVSPPGSKAYGVLSVLCQYFTTPTILFTAPKEAFLPKPQVESALIKMTPKPPEETDNPLLVPLVKQSFRERRKTLYNNLKSWEILSPDEWKKILSDLGLDEKIRAEAVSLEMYILLAKNLQK